jgi:peptidoglycan hydrolase-like protein with peptidoglycan-binding domain
MNNDDIKKYIDLSKLYTKVDLEKNEKVDEGILDWLENWLDGKKAKQAVDAIPADVRKDLDKVVDDNKLAGVDAGSNIQGNNFATDADGNITSKDKPIQPGGQNAGAQAGKSFTDIGQAMLGVDQVKVGDKVTIGGQDATVTTGEDGKKFYIGSNGKPIGAAATAGNDGSVDAVGSEEDPTVTDQEGGVAQGMDQADAAAAEPANTKDLMTRYNEGGKKAMPEIKKLQTELGRLGFDPNGIDGKYGNGTFKAVQQFQKANGLQVDGQAGTNTLAAIEKSINGTPKGVAANNTQASAQASNDAQAAQDKADADAKAKDDPMTAANQQKDIDTAQPNFAKQARDQKALNKKVQADADVDRYIELLNKLEGGQVNAGTPNATQGQVVASYDFRNLIALVESKLLNEQLTQAEMEELKALHNKVQGHVGIDAELDTKITTALNRYLKLVKEPTKAAAVDQEGGVAQGMDQADAATKAEPKVSKESYIQMAPNRNASLANFNVSQMKKKYPKPYVDMPQADGTVHRGYGPLVNLEDFVKNNPKLKAKIIGKPAQQAGIPNAERDGAERGVQTASKDNNMKKAIEEASMNISINGDSAAEVAELAGILKNAGMHDANPVSDILPRPGEKPAIAIDSPVRSVPGGAAFDLDYDGHDDMVSKMKMMDEPAPDDSPCGMGEEGVEEDSWDNSPDESYADTQTMTKDLSGGLNREKKSYPAAQDGDNPMAVENSIKEQLWAALNEKMTTEGSRGKKSRGKKKSRG